MKKVLIAFVIVAVIASAFGVWYFVIRDDSLEVSAKNVDTSQTSKPLSEQSTPDGSWTIQQQDDVFVGYEIEELFGGDSIKKTAIGETPSVEGSLAIEGSTISDIDITVDMTDLESDSSQRDSRMQNEGLEISDFPEASFTQSEPVTFDGEFVKNQEVTISIPGELTLHGVTKNVTVEITAIWNGKVITVSGDIPITLSDYDIEPPNSSFVAVDEEGSIKLQLLFVPQN